MTSIELSLVDFLLPSWHLPALEKTRSTPASVAGQARNWRAMRSQSAPKCHAPVGTRASAPGTSYTAVLAGPPTLSPLWTQVPKSPPRVRARNRRCLSGAACNHSCLPVVSAELPLQAAPSSWAAWCRRPFPPFYLSAPNSETLANSSNWPSGGDFKICRADTPEKVNYH